MNKDYEEEKKKAEETVKYAKMSGMVDNITYAKYTYPDKFYLVLEKLDLVMRVWNGEKMGTCGVEELAGLMAILKLDYELLYDMPLEAHVFFRCILNPKMLGKFAIKLIWALAIYIEPIVNFVHF